MVRNVELAKPIGWGILALVIWSIAINGLHRVLSAPGADFADWTLGIAWVIGALAVVTWIVVSVMTFIEEWEPRR